MHGRSNDPKVRNFFGVPDLDQLLVPWTADDNINYRDNDKQQELQNFRMSLSVKVCPNISTSMFLFIFFFCLICSSNLTVELRLFSFSREWTLPCNFLFFPSPALQMHAMNQWPAQFDTTFLFKNLSIIPVFLFMVLHGFSRILFPCRNLFFLFRTGWPARSYQTFILI